MRLIDVLVVLPVVTAPPGSSTGRLSCLSLFFSFCGFDLRYKTYIMANVLVRPHVQNDLSPLLFFFTTPLAFCCLSKVTRAKPSLQTNANTAWEEIDSWSFCILKGLYEDYSDSTVDLKNKKNKNKNRAKMVQRELRLLIQSNKGWKIIEIALGCCSWEGGRMWTVELYKTAKAHMCLVSLMRPQLLKSEGGRLLCCPAPSDITAPSPSGGEKKKKSLRWIFCITHWTESLSLCRGSGLAAGSELQDSP